MTGLSEHLVTGKLIPAVEIDFKKKEHRVINKYVSPIYTTQANNSQNKE